MLLITVARDEEDQILFLTWGFMSIKSINNWSFFLTYFHHMFPSLRDKEFMIINDQNKGLEPVLAIEFLDIISSYCYYHLGENFMKFHPEGEVRDLF